MVALWEVSALERLGSSLLEARSRAKASIRSDEDVVFIVAQPVHFHQELIDGGVMGGVRAGKAGEFSFGGPFAGEGVDPIGRGCCFHCCATRPFPSGID